MTFILWEGTARLKNSRGNIYLPLISICSKNYSHTASRSYCNFSTAKLELPGLCLPSCTRELTRGSHWPPGIVFNYCFSLGDDLLPQQFWQPGMCPSWHTGNSLSPLVCTGNKKWLWETSLREASLRWVVWAIFFDSWPFGGWARAQRSISASRKTASLQRLAPPQSPFNPVPGRSAECRSATIAKLCPSGTVALPLPDPPLH